MLNVLFFAQVRERVGCDSLALDEVYSNVEQLRTALVARGSRWALGLESGKLLAAVNQTLVEFNHPLEPGDEVAFFPPVTGG